MKDKIREKGKSLGFCMVGFTTSEPLDESEHLNDYISSGRMAGMRWMARTPERRCDPCALFPKAKSIICVALPYGNGGLPWGASRIGDLRMAKFARGEEYHYVMRSKLFELWQFISREYFNASCKICVDTSPILEKALAERAGIGWIGKHTILVNEKLGSWFVLGEIFTDIEFPPDGAAKNLCGECRACVDACPTEAIIEPQILDARKCLSYLTIEHKGEIPKEFRPFTKKYIYGCDACQDACPYNRK